MSISLLVFAPSIAVPVIGELEQSVCEATNRSVAVGGYFGVEKRAAAFNPDIGQLLKWGDLNHYWAIVKLSVEAGSVLAAKKIVEKLAETFVDWAVKNREGNKKAKLKIYGPDGEVLKEIDG